MAQNPKGVAEAGGAVPLLVLVLVLLVPPGIVDAAAELAPKANIVAGPPATVLAAD